jgi:4'-phosphopantetheinyl transferase
LNATTGGRTLPHNELWLVDLERCAEALGRLEQAVPRLLPQERVLMLSIEGSSHSRWQTSLRIALRLLLERAAGPGVRGLPILRAAGGKPALAGAPAVFSLSHTGHLALIGVAHAGPIGVDLERVRPLRLTDKRRRAILASAAGLAVKPTHAADGDRALVQAWCRIEAYAKATGRGLAAALVELGVWHAPAAPAPSRLRSRARECARAASLAIHDVELDATLVGAIALAAGEMPAPVGQLPADLAGLERVARRSD